jgi:3-mercaptopyruvate sulfurtransferase SseA
MKQSNPEKVATVVFYHENAGNIGTRLQYVLEYYTRVKVNILLIAYRGYSKSTGNPTEFGIQIDGKVMVSLHHPMIW